MAPLPEILVVDDDPTVCKLMQRILENHGYYVSTAHCGTEALRILDKSGRDFRLLVTDVLMPDMSGPALARAAASGFRNCRCSMFQVIWAITATAYQRWVAS